MKQESAGPDPSIPFPESCRARWGQWLTDLETPTTPSHPMGHGTSRLFICKSFVNGNTSHLAPPCLSPGSPAPRLWTYAMPSPTDDEPPFPPLSHAAAFNAFGRSHLSPHDAHPSPTRRARDFDGQNGTAPLRGPDAERSRSRRRKRAWKKLMWVKQSCTSIASHIIISQKVL